MDAYRRGDRFYVHLDLAGVDPGSINLTAEQNVLTIEAERHWDTRDSRRRVEPAGLRAKGGSQPEVERNRLSPASLSVLSSSARPPVAPAGRTPCGYPRQEPAAAGHCRAGCARDRWRPAVVRAWLDNRTCRWDSNPRPPM
jgi:hypothetical protein